MALFFSLMKDFWKVWKSQKFELVYQVISSSLKRNLKQIISSRNSTKPQPILSHTALARSFTYLQCSSSRYKATDWSTRFISDPSRPRAARRRPFPSWSRRRPAPHRRWPPQSPAAPPPDPFPTAHLVWMGGFIIFACYNSGFFCVKREWTENSSFKFSKWHQ